MRRCWLGSLALLLGICAASRADGPTTLPATVGMVATLPGSPDSLPGNTTFPNWAPRPEMPDGHLYGNIEYLFWWMRRDHEPAIITSGSRGESPSGAIGEPGTDVLFGGDVGGHYHNGVRVTAGYQLNDCFGVEGNYFALEQRSNVFGVGSNGSLGSAIIARPFVDFTTGKEDAQLVASPGFRAGTIEAALHQRLQGSECNLTADGWDEADFHLRLLTGVRYLALDESLDIADQFTALTKGGSSATDAESFGTHNRFYGGQIGASAEYGDRLFLSATGKIALGATVESININGTLVTSSPLTGSYAGPGGLLTQASNIGHYHHDRFAVAPEVDINIGYKFGDSAKAYVGYSLVGLSDAAEPGNQIDRVVQTPTIPPGPVNPARPLFNPVQSGFWAQGITLGLAFCF
jgi:hypothetical protein